MGCVYCATNNVNGKSYVGKTYRSLEERRKEHFTDNKSCYFHKALKKYGKHSFTWRVLYENDDEAILYDMEKVFIAELNTYVPNGYNMTTGGDGQYTRKFSKAWHEANKLRALRLGKSVYCVELNKSFDSLALAVKATRVAQATIVASCNDWFHPYKQYHFCWEEDKEKLQQLHKENRLLYGQYRNRTNEAFYNRSRAHTGRKMSDEQRKAYSERMLKRNHFKGKKHTKESLEKISRSRRGKMMGSTNPSARSVINLTDGKIFECIKNAVEFYKLPQKAGSNISSCCSGKLKTAYSYEWAYYISAESRAS